ncbi:MAG: prolyl oligopeptidase family serine peptidase [Armatimonadota bacterium]|jgi:dienelactone hydrolase
MPARGPLRTREAWRREYRTHTQIKLIYEGEPGETIPAYLLVPRDAPSGPLPAILAAHQCAWQCDVGKEQVVGKCVDWPDQAYGLELVREGFIVLAPDANKVGERYDPELREQWQTAAELGGQHACCTAPGGSWGPIRWKPVYDVMRGVDFLAAHQRVDRERIGMIGHSLGADTTLWAMPLEERITAAAISGGGIIADWLPYGLPYADILKLLAPRPFLEVVGRADPINWGETEPAPASVDERMRGKRDAHAQAREVYALDGAEERLACYEHEGGHCFPEEGRREAYAWLKKWLVP